MRITGAFLFRITIINPTFVANYGFKKSGRHPHLDVAQRYPQFGRDQFISATEQNPHHRYRPVCGSYRGLDKPHRQVSGAVYQHDYQYFFLRYFFRS